MSTFATSRYPGDIARLTWGCSILGLVCIETMIIIVYDNFPSYAPFTCIVVQSRATSRYSGANGHTVLLVLRVPWDRSGMVRSGLRNRRSRLQNSVSVDTFKDHRLKYSDFARRRALAHCLRKFTTFDWSTRSPDCFQAWWARRFSLKAAVVRESWWFFLATGSQTSIELS